jgi:hypothetical protein
MEAAEVSGRSRCVPAEYPEDDQRPVVRLLPAVKPSARENACAETHIARIEVGRCGLRPQQSRPWIHRRPIRNPHVVRSTCCMRGTPYHRGTATRADATDRRSGTESAYFLSVIRRLPSSIGGRCAGISRKGLPPCGWRRSISASTTPWSNGMPARRRHQVRHELRDIAIKTHDCTSPFRAKLRNKGRRLFSKEPLRNSFVVPYPYSKGKRSWIANM